MRVAILTTDSREHYKTYDSAVPAFGTAPEALLQGLSRIPELEVHVMCCARRRMASPAKLAENIWYHGLHVPAAGWMRTGYLGCARAIRRRLNLIQPDIVHGQGTERDNAMGAVLSGYPNVITLHGIMREMAKVLQVRPGSFFWFASMLESFALRRASGAFCNSHYTREKVAPRARRTWLVPNAVREPFFEKPAGSERVGRPILLNVGSVNCYKRQNELLDVLELLRAEGLDFEARFLGNAGRETAYGARFLDRVTPSPYLSYRGFKSNAELIEAFDGASALVHASAIETFGLVVAEALCRDVSFFGFNLGGVPDIVQGVKGTELVADGDWKALGNRIRNWIKAGAPRAPGAATLMKGRFHPDVIARRHVEIYREVLSNRS